MAFILVLCGRIIITTRDEHLLISHNVEAANKVKKLNHSHALELFSWFAFKKKNLSSNKLQGTFLTHIKAESLSIG